MGVTVSILVKLRKLFDRIINLFSSMNPNHNENQNRQPYRPIPGQLVNENLLRNKASRSLFPKEAVVDQQGRIVNPKQFIVASTGKDLDQLTPGNFFWLEPLNRSSDRVKIKVVKSRKCCPDGKRYVLLETAPDRTTDPATILSLEGGDIEVFDKGDSTNVIGVIHPGDSNPGGQGHSSGQTNTYGVNLLVKLKPGRVLSRTNPEIGDLNNIATYERDANPGRPTVAVLDSGIHFTKQSVEQKGATCEDSACFGWDFVNDTPFPIDDHLGLHGTKISSIIKKYAPNAGILPVKVSNRAGAVTLYDALCGLEYARCRGAQIINASWSFTGKSEVRRGPVTDYPLLLNALEDLKKAGVTVVAAAGNKTQYTHPDGHITTPRIYPACYSDMLNNVITVTTVTQGNVPQRPTGALAHRFAAYENFSPEFVDTGVLTNVITPMRSGFMPGRFEIPGFVDSYEGTSFAAPVVAAKLANDLTRLTSGHANKADALQHLPGYVEENDLAYAIRNGGNYIKVE